MLISGTPGLAQGSTSAALSGVLTWCLKGNSWLRDKSKLHIGYTA